MKDKQSKYVICTRNSGHEASLELRKLYRVVADSSASSHGHIRIIDESGEDYLYPLSYFIHVDLPDRVTDRLTQVT